MENLNIGNGIFVMIRPEVMHVFGLYFHLSFYQLWKVY